MSVQAIAWVLDSEVPIPPQLVSVLIALANQVDGEGRGAWPAQATIAKQVRKTERQVRRDLDQLEELGLIRRGDQNRALYLPADRRPVVWDLIMTGGHPRPPGHPGSNGGTSRVERGDMGVRQPVLNPEDNPSSSVPLDGLLVETTFYGQAHGKTADSLAAGFGEFWKTYPRRVGRAAAEKAWAKAVTRTPAHVILAGAARYRQDPNRVDRFTKHPTTWLNQGCWEDDPLPQRSRSPEQPSSVEDIFDNARAPSQEW